MTFSFFKPTTTIIRTFTPFTSFFKSSSICQNYLFQIRHYTARKPKKISPLAAPVYGEKKLDDNSLFISRVPLTPPKITVDQLPPPLRPIKEQRKRKHTKEQIEEMKRLRASDPAKYSLSVLSKMFDCPSHIIAQFAPLPLERKAILEARKEYLYSKMGWKKRIIRAERIRRRALW
ncbi:hypothetical protein Glove_669g4 [Diversispora epigaea]|uniref:Uncharacterized protein n=1 Tax=Diversispora epigaea TaxID=1348612 RepID=A0A397G4P2_9GLOM|nr:hypothetical protein Glove_669g4 [Diversispora epigaea]